MDLSGLSDDQLIQLYQQSKGQPAPQLPEAATRPEFNLPGIGTVSTPPTENGFNLPAAMIGAGRTFDRVRAGIDQFQQTGSGTIATMFGADKTAQALADRQARDAITQRSNDAAYKNLQSVHPGSTMAGESTPLLFAPPAVLPAIGALEYGTPQERFTRAAGAYLGNKVAQGAGSAVAERIAPQDARAFANANLVAPPEQVNPTLLNKILGGLSGGAKNEQAASRANQPQFAAMAQKELGFPKQTEVNPDTLAAYRARQYQEGYKPLSDIPSIKEDQAFVAALPGLSPANSGGAIPNPAQPQINDLIKNLLNKSEWTGPQLVSDIRLLRESASANFSAAQRSGGDIEKMTLAKAQRAAADRLEELAARQGGAKEVAAFQEARRNIAKAHDIEDTMVGGQIAPAKLSDAATGDLALMRDFARKYPGSAKPVNSATKANPFSVPDAMVAAMPALYTGIQHGALPGAAVAAAGYAARPMLRGLLMSPRYQRMMLPAEDVGLLGKLIQNPALPYAGGLLGYSAGR